MFPKFVRYNPTFVEILVFPDFRQSVRGHSLSLEICSVSFRSRVFRPFRVYSTNTTSCSVHHMATKSSHLRAFPTKLHCYSADTCFLSVLPSSVSKTNVARRPGNPFYGRPYDDLQFLSPTILVIIDWTLLDRATRSCVYAAEFENLCNLPKQRIRLESRHWEAEKFENLKK